MYLLHRPDTHNVLLGVEEIGNKAHVTWDGLLRAVCFIEISARPQKVMERRCDLHVQTSTSLLNLLQLLIHTLNVDRNT